MQAQNPGDSRRLHHQSNNPSIPTQISLWINAIELGCADQCINGAADLPTSDMTTAPGRTYQPKVFSSMAAAALEEAGFWPVINRPSLTTYEPQSAPLE